MSVMDVKRGTQSFSTSPQTSSLRSDDKTQNYSAGELKSRFGEDSVGDTLNKITDPNYIDPSKKIRTTGGTELGKDAFMKLMLAQMKNQDPTKPMESQEMAAQLAQFTSLEQLNNINTTLTDMKAQASPKANFQALALIGKKVSGDGAKITRVAGDTKHTSAFQLMGDAASVTAKVKDAKGDVIRTLQLSAMKKGANSVTWDGMGQDGVPARPGDYRIEIEALSSSKAKVYAKTQFSGKITGLNYTSEGPVLIVGEQTVRLSDVKKIEDAGPDDANSTAAAASGTAGNAPKNRAVPSTTLNAPSNAVPLKAADENIPPAQEQDQKPVGNLAQLNMSPELYKRIEKSGVP